MVAGIEQKKNYSDQTWHLDSKVMYESDGRWRSGAFAVISTHNIKALRLKQQPCCLSPIPFLLLC